MNTTTADQPSQDKLPEGFLSAWMGDEEAVAIGGLVTRLAPNAESISASLVTYDSQDREIRRQYLLGENAGTLRIRRPFVLEEENENG